MAISDFYAEYANSLTRLTIFVKDSANDTVAASSETIELMNNQEIHVIIGPQKSTQAKFVIDLGEKAQIPIISYSATSPSLDPTHNPYFIRTCQDDYNQVQAIATLVQNFGWQEVVLIYEDTEFGNGLIPYLTDALQQVKTRVCYRSVISPSSNYQLKIAKELGQIMARKSRVLLVHMTAFLGSELFRQAAEVGMMSKGFAWIVTDGFSTLLDPTISNVFDSMQGVLGVRPLVPLSKGLSDFKMRWKTRFFNGTDQNGKNTEISLFGLWAYDTIWAVAKAVETVAKIDYSVFGEKVIGRIDESDSFGIRVSKSGSMLLERLERTKFEGLSGEFDLRRRQLQPVPYEIVNVVEKRERIIGYWKRKEGIVSVKTANSSRDALKTIIWPGSTKAPPKGWVLPIIGDQLKIGVPVTNGFKKFTKVEWDPRTNEPKISGFSHDIFLEALDKLPFAVPYKFIPYANSSRKMAGTYDQFISEINHKKFDAVIGDITILANRASHVDFTLPYYEAGVSMIVKIKDDKKNIWIFLKPLSLDLWLTTGCAFVFTGFIIWILEHRTNAQFRGENLVNNWSRFVMIIWIFVVLILTQSYTASLASILTVQRLQPAIVDVDKLIRNGAFVGYLKNSYVREFLIAQLKFNESKLKFYTSPEEYHEALSKGSKNGGVEAIFDEIPFIKLFLAKYCSKYMMAGPTYRSDGFGFAFSLGSPLVSHFSRAILNVTQDYKRMQELEYKYFGDYKTKCEDQAGSIFSSDGPSLSVYSFGGLFIITGLASICSCVIYLVKFYRNHWSAVNSVHPGSSLLRKFSTMAKHFDKKDDIPLDTLNQSSDSISIRDQLSPGIDEGI
ncbi:hypothetical protein TIFTF001_034450 [Ficus carica]|uniref:Glutamate receptor n=1 Tax=Ficus carica TaxID=3494 RepID=A0AA88E1A7_FICCA|nr:hypothetical protein TIFTF001_034450 [Ficus carica]